MITGIDRNERVPFSVKSDEGEAKTIFWIGNLLQRDRIELFGQAVTREGKVDPMVIQAKAIDIFLKSVKKIENLGTVGSVIEKIDEAVVDTLPYPVLMEVVAEIMNINFVSENERKN